MSLSTSITPPPAIRRFRVGFAAIALNFLVPALSYVVAPQAAEQSFSALNQLSGGDALAPEQTLLWHMLAVGNVATLGWMCAMLLADLRRFHPLLPALLFLKGFSATYSAGIAAWHGIPAFYAVTVLDGGTTLAMAWLAERAIDALDGRPPVALWVQLALPRPRQILANLERFRALGWEAPNLWQVFLGTLYMRARIAFRPSTLGMSRRAVRRGWRARALQFRAIRVPFLAWERAIAPFDLSGLALTPERLAVHLAGAHHDGAQFSYDLELLTAHPGSLLELRDSLRSLLAEGGQRLEWLRDLCVFEGYHEDLLAGVEAACEGRSVVPEGEAAHPDVTLRAWLAWCARQPSTPRATVRAWRRGALSFAPPRVAAQA